jgi:hypothetical protein
MGEFYFRPPTPATIASPTPSPASPDTETVFWQSIMNSTDPKDYQDYLQQFPNGHFAAIARRRSAEEAVHRGMAAYDRQNYAEALGWWRQAADQGDALAETAIGAMYAEGYGVHQDYAEAVRWYRKAADQGHAVAELNLGIVYDGGFGVPQDRMQARYWMQRAAAHGNSEAAAWLAQHRASPWWPWTRTRMSSAGSSLAEVWRRLPRMRWPARVIAALFRLPARRSTERSEIWTLNAVRPSKRPELLDDPEGHPPAAQSDRLAG